MTADPYKASAATSSPESLNQYAHVEGDPINSGDPTGEYSCSLDTAGGGEF